jgi:hypothetical protein
MKFERELKYLQSFYSQSKTDHLFFTDLIKGNNYSINKLLHLLEDLQDLRNSLQYNILNLYITHKDLLSQILTTKVENNKVENKEVEKDYASRFMI